MFVKDSRSFVVSALVLFIVISGFLGLCNRNLHEFGLGPQEISLTRSIVTVAGLLVIIAASRHKLTLLKPVDLVIFALFGAFKLLSDLTLFAAQDNIALGLATLLQMSSPFYVLVLSFYLFKEKITYKKILLMFTAFIGLMLVCDVFTTEKSISYYGIMCGIASGFFFALYAIGGKVCVDRGYDPINAMFYIFVFSLIFNLPLADVGDTLAAFTVPDALVNILAMGILMTLAPFGVIIWATTKIPPSEVSMFGVLEAVSAAVVGLVFFDEALTLNNILGMGIVIASIILLNIQATKLLRKVGILKNTAP